MSSVLPSLIVCGVFAGGLALLDKPTTKPWHIMTFVIFLMMTLFAFTELGVDFGEPEIRVLGGPA